MPAGVLDPDCLFCKIIRGEIPCQRVFEDEHVFAFLDIKPLASGHTVLVPKHHVAELENLPAEWAAELGRCFGRLGQTVTRVVGGAGYNVLQNNGAVAGQVIPHVHFHIVPRRADDGLGYRWRARSASPEELTELAGRIAAAL